MVSFCARIQLGARLRKLQRRRAPPLLEARGRLLLEQLELRGEALLWIGVGLGLGLGLGFGFGFGLWLEGFRAIGLPRARVRVWLGLGLEVRVRLLLPRQLRLAPSDALVARST